MENGWQPNGFNPDAYFFKEEFIAAQHKNRIDDQIFSREVRVIDDTDGKQLGIFSIEDALALAREKDLNLVEVAPDAKPPVCKIMDYGKFKYQQKKKEQKAKSKQHQVVLKEIRVRPKTDHHDIETKVRNARKFLEQGHKVQVNMLFRGREMMHLEVGREVMKGIIESLADISKVEKPPGQEGRRMIMVLVKKERDR